MYIPAFPILGSPPSSDPGPEEERSSRHRAMRHPGHRDGHGERLGAGWDDPAAGSPLPHPWVSRGRRRVELMWVWYGMVYWFKLTVPQKNPIV